MRSLLAALFVASGTLIVLSNYVLTPPLKVPALRAGERAVSARDALSNLAAAGQRVYSGSCADCHGEHGTGGSARRLDTLAFARGPRRSRDLHDMLNNPIVDHAGLSEELGNPGAKERFNEVERVGKYLREVRLKRRRRSDD